MWFTKKEKAAQLYSFVPAFPAVLSVLPKGAEAHQTFHPPTPPWTPCHDTYCFSAAATSTRCVLCA